MALFKKRGVEVIDFSELQKRGTLERARKIERSTSINEGKVLDLSSANSRASTLGESSSEPASAFNFLDNLAGASSREISGSISGVSADNEIKIKIDDLTFKLERFMEKLALIESRLDEMERRG